MTLPTERLEWRKSSRCGNATCVEVAKGDKEVFVRDSKNPAVILSFSPDEWDAFLDAAGKGEFRF
jgi:hypothetical protein